MDTDLAGQPSRADIQPTAGAEEDVSYPKISRNNIVPRAISGQNTLLPGERNFEERMDVVH